MVHRHHGSGFVTLAALAAASGLAVGAPAQCEGDLNGDGSTDVFDFGALTAAFGTSQGDPAYDPAADLVPDGRIDVFDFSAFAADFGCEAVRLRAMSFNLEDVRTEQLLDGTDARLRDLAEVIQILAPDILLLNEVAYDYPGDVPGEPEGLNGQRFADHYLAVGQGGQAAIQYTAYTWPSNTGVHTGFDLDNNGFVDPIPENNPNINWWGNDCHGFATFPGQFAMTLLVRDDAPLEVLAAQARTFRLFLWKDMPGYLEVTDPFNNNAPWYTQAELDVLRLSSKSHWDVPVRLPDGSLLHVLASHPTPPVFDTLEDRNGKRNHDEIRFWADYVLDEPYFYDDLGGAGGLATDRAFVILGDLNADPVDGASFDNPIGNLIAPNPEVNFLSPAGAPIPGYDDTDTAFFGLRVDYALPSDELEVVGTGVEREAGSFTPDDGPSDHWPVWVDFVVGDR
jgi:hypothetical protein